MELPTKKSEKTSDFLRQNVLIYGPPKIGKTTFAATINDGENVLFACTEDGHKHVEIFKVDIKRWEDIGELYKTLKTTKHGYKFIVFDLISDVYDFLVEYICEKNKVKDLSDMPWGSGYNEAKRAFHNMLNSFNSIGLSVCMISHSETKERECDDGIKRVYTDTSLPAKPNNIACGLCDFIFYVHSDGKNRVARTKPAKTINAGDRTGRLPEIVPLNYGEIIKCLGQK